MIFLHPDAAAPPVEVTLVERRSADGVAAARTVAWRDPAPDAVADSPTPRKKWLSLRDSGGGVVLSYFWPVVQGQTSFYELAMSSPNVIDIRSSANHGSPEERRYWRGKGKLLLNRVHPFREERS